MALCEKFKRQNLINVSDSQNVEKKNNKKITIFCIILLRILMEANFNVFRIVKEIKRKM